MEEQEMTQENFQPSQTTKTVSAKASFHALQGQYEQVRERNREVADKIAALLKYRQDRTYHLLVSDKTDYFSSMWQHMQKQLATHSPFFEPDLLAMFSGRQGSILSDIMEDRLEIELPKPRAGESEEEMKQRKLNMLRDQSSEIQRKLLDINESMDEMKSGQNTNTESRFKPFEIKEEKLKEYEEFMRRQKREKEERQKMQEEQRKKEEELKQKKQQEQKELREKQMKERKEELLKKVRESQEKREKERMEREQRSKDYKYISKSLAQQPPLFKKLQQNYYHRYQKSELENRKKAMSERHSMFQAVDTKAIEEHEKKYEDIRAEKERQRRERLEDYERMLQMQQEEIQSRYRSNFELTGYIDKKAEERKIAQEKREKMKKFIEETVKERYLPRIDEQKRKQFLQIIQNLSRNKPLRKVKREDGNFDYEEVKPSDPKMVGLQYLQLTKEMAAKMRANRKNSDNAPTIQNQKPRTYDYLAEQRKKGSSKSHRDRMEFVNRKGLSFDQKLKKVQLESEKLQQLAKQKEMKLKFGKFSTSEEILQHKEEIDQHYIDIINMKLKLINHQ